MTGGSDARLIAGALEGSEKAFGTLVERYHPMTYSIVRAVLGDRDDVDDVVQEVFIKVYRGLSRFRREAKFSTWLYRIARNEAINASKRRTFDARPIDDVVIEAPPGSRPDENYARQAEQADLDRHLAQLDENYRTVLELRYMGDKSYAEIGETMDLPIGTVKTYIHRAKIELKRLMTRTTAREDATRSKRS